MLVGWKGHTSRAPACMTTSSNGVCGGLDPLRRVRPAFASVVVVVVVAVVAVAIVVVVGTSVGAVVVGAVVVGAAVGSGQPLGLPKRVARHSADSSVAPTLRGRRATSTRTPTTTMTRQRLRAMTG